MIVPLQPYKLKCPKCNYSKIIKKTSDKLNLLELIQECPKCKTQMEKVELMLLDKLFSL